MTLVRLSGLSLSPVVLLGVAGHLYAGAPGGPLLALLVVLAPCVALASGPAEAAEESLLVVVLTVVAAGLLLTANLLLIGDIAGGLGAPRWHGVVIAAGCAFVLTIWPAAAGWWTWLVPGALALGWLALAAVGLGAGVDPAAAWSDVASRPAFRFPEASPWVVSGRSFPTPGSLLFTEPHTLRTARADVFGVVVDDGGTPSVQEWRPEAGETITMRPGDRLAYAGGARLVFEGGKRVPGTPASGAAWGDGAAGMPSLAWLARSLGLAVTFVAGGLPLLRVGPRPTRRRLAVALALLLAGVGWAEGWAIYAARAAPDLFLGAARAGALTELPARALGEPWGRRLCGLVVAAVIALFAGSAAGLRERLAAGDRSGGGLGRDLPLWVVVLGGATAASLWPRDPWTLLVLGLGLLASTLGPLALAPPGAPPGARTLACVVGLAVFVGIALGGRLLGGDSALAAYPALLAAPAAWTALRLAGPRPA